MPADKRPFHLDKTIFLDALKNAFAMLSPFDQFRNPVMFITYLAALFSTLYLVVNPSSFSGFNLQIALWLWLTVLVSNFAQAFAESRGKAQALHLKKAAQKTTFAKLIREGVEVKVPINILNKGDVILCEVGDIIPADGEVIKGIATVDESAITGESAPVIRESGGDRSSVIAGTKIVSDQLFIAITTDIQDNFLNRIIQQIENVTRYKSPNELALNVVLSGLALIFLLTASSMPFLSAFNPKHQHTLSFPVWTAILVSLIPTTVSALLNPLGVSGMTCLFRRNVVAKSSRAVEGAGDIDLMLLDKTGTITLGNRMASEFLPFGDINEEALARIAQLASLSDETPEGRSIVILAKEKFGLREPQIDTALSKFIPFSAKTRISGIDFFDDKGKIIRRIRKGAPDVIQSHIERLGGTFHENMNSLIESISIKGGTPLLVSDDRQIIGLIHLKDTIKGGIKEKFEEMRKMGIRTVMITGDNPLTAAVIAAEAGLDDFIADATPEVKLQLIRKEQKNGCSVAMIGDGTNDAPALAQADIGVAMNTGTQISREAGNMVDLDSNPTKLLEIVKISKQLLITRGALMIFSLTNNFAKFFAIIPAVFGHFYAVQNATEGPLSLLNVMKLHSPKSAILSMVIYNALAIAAFIPMVMKCMKYHAQTSHSLMKNNILLFGLGGIIAPFIGIKLIDMLIVMLGLV